MHDKAFEIVYQDEWLIILNKVAKILIEPSPHKEKHTLTSLLSAHQKAAAYPCHRLDRETTGLIIYAKDRQTQEKMMQSFKHSRVRKKYLAFVKGAVKSQEGRLKGLIIDREGSLHGEKPKMALTDYKVRQRLPGFSVLELTPHTGRTNQLRIQLAQKGHPILGERKYAFGRDFDVKFKRLALHAYFLEFTHPVTAKCITLELPLAYDMAQFLKTRQSDQA
jgi:23S rRNA pseudouridine1911/1915/1917 synthase